jgi:GTP-binding protein
MLKQAGMFRANEQVRERVLDSNDLERERGITILAKNTAVQYKNVKINILDTPGHADFGGEVERIMRLVDGVLLVVDAFEGCMPQTRFVLKKALEQKLTPIVVINKIDRENARPEEVVDEVLDLFIELGADEDQLDFPVVYTSAVKGTAGLDPREQDSSLEVLFETIVRTVPAPVDNRDEPLQMQVALLDYNDYIGRIGIGRIFRGTMRTGEQVALMKLDGSVKHFRVTKMFGFMGLKRVEIEEAYAGDLVAVSGMGDILVGETICPVEAPDPLPPLRIDEPTLKMTFLVNNSPFAGREGKFVTARKIEERLKLELQTDVSLRVEPTDSPDAWIVSGRGELHLAILIETMRREGFELQVSKPEVIEKEIDGKICEPFERVVIDVPEEYSGQVIESLGRRKGNLLDMRHAGNGQVRLVYSVPSRGLIGYQSELMSMTRGYAIYNHSFEEYRPKLPFEIGRRERGVLVALETGTASTYGILQLEDRGTIFVEPGTEVYEGMIVGEHNRENDLTVNICKTKHATNIRSATKEQTQIMKKPRIFTLEEALQYLDDDEYCEVTPKSIRLRKKILNKSEREKLAKKRKM